MLKMAANSRPGRSIGGSYKKNKGKCFPTGLKIPINVFGDLEEGFALRRTACEIDQGIWSPELIK